QVTHVLLTRSRLCPRASPGSSLHLHVLSTPPAFVLSQDQTLRKNFTKSCRGTCRAVPSESSAPRGGRDLYTESRTMTGYCSLTLLSVAVPIGDRPTRGAVPATGRTWTQTTTANRSWLRMLLSFQRPPRPLERASFGRNRCDPVALRRAAGQPRSI